MGKWFTSFWEDERRLRRRLFIAHVGLFAFWIYSVEYICAHPAAKGSDGFEFLLAIPMTLIAVFLSLPALLLLFSKRTIQYSAPVTLAAVVTNVLLGSEILWNSGLRHGPLWPIW